MPPKKAKKDDDKGDKDKKKTDAGAVSDAIRFFPEQKRLERLEEENTRILLSFKGLHGHLQAQVLDQEDILQHFEREMGAKDKEIQALLSEIKVQQALAADAVALSQQEVSRAKADCLQTLAAKDAEVQELRDNLHSTESLRERIAALEQQLQESTAVLDEERLFCRDEIVRIASEHEAKVSALRLSYQDKSGGIDAQLEARAQARAQQIISDIFSQSKNVMAEVAFLQQQLQAASDRMGRMTEKNRTLQLQLEISDGRCEELLKEGQTMRALVEQQGKRIDGFNDGMKKLSSAAAAAAAKDEIIQQLRLQIDEKDAYIQKLLAKFNKESLGGAATGSSALSPRTGVTGAPVRRPVADQNAVPLGNCSADSSSLGRGKDALEQLEFLAKVFEQELGIAETASSQWAASFGKKDSPRPRPSPIIAPEKLQAMLAVESQAPPPIATSSHDAAPASRPLFLARRLRQGTGTPPALASQPLEVDPPLVSVFCLFVC
jgi:hypothetical protein